MEKKALIPTVACIIILLVSIAGNLWLWTSLDQANSKITSLETTIDTHESEIETLESQVDSLQSEKESLEADYESLLHEHGILQANYTELDIEYSALDETLQSLLSDYTTLDEQHQILVIEYNELSESYNILTIDYSMLEIDYGVLSLKYQILFSDYNALVEAFNEPLSYEVMPTTFELQSWLWEDDTDKIWYDDPNFVCGDFAVMLSQHAKLEHWDMGVVGVFGYDENYESYAHAFNAIVCTEGLVYVEPQTDEVWWYTDHKEISEGIWWETSENGYIYIEDYIEILWYD